jgi:hypothetical protein
MGYYDYKFIHIGLVVIYMYSVMNSSFRPTQIIPKIILGLTSLFLLGSGFLLLNRFGISLTGPYPIWIWVKFGIWFLLAMVPPILIKTFPKRSIHLNAVYMVLVLAASYLGIFKP